MSDKKPTQYQVNQEGLPDKYPTQAHEAAFWESLGRAVATFGTLEVVMGKAIFAFTGMRSYEEKDIEQAYKNWFPKLEHALSDPLGKLTNIYEKAVKDHPDALAVIEGFDELLVRLREISKMRNILCHAAWPPPNPNGASIPYFVTPKMQFVDTEMDRQYIDQVQQCTVALICEVINTVARMGWQFPGTVGSGKTIWEPIAQHFTAADGR